MLLLTPLTIRFSPQTAQKLQRKTIEKKYKHEIDVRSLFRSSPAVPRRAHTLPSFPFHRRSTRRPLPMKPSLNNGHVTLVASPSPHAFLLDCFTNASSAHRTLLYTPLSLSFDIFSNSDSPLCAICVGFLLAGKNFARGLDDLARSCPWFLLGGRECFGNNWMVHQSM